MIDVSAGYSPVGWSAVRLGVRVGEGGRQLPMGVGLVEQGLGFMLEGLDGVGARGPAQRRFAAVDQPPAPLRVALRLPSVGRSRI